MLRMRSGPSSDIVPDQDSIEGKRKRSHATGVPVELSLPRMVAVASAVGQEGQGVVNAVVWRVAEKADCENSVSHYMATSSLAWRVNIVNHQSST